MYFTGICITAAIPPPQVRVRYPCEEGGSFFLLVNLLLLEETEWKQKQNVMGIPTAFPPGSISSLGTSSSGAIKPRWAGRKSTNIQNETLRVMDSGLLIAPLSTSWDNEFYLLETQHHVIDIGHLLNLRERHTSLQAIVHNLIPQWWLHNSVSLARSGYCIMW